jgi:hypothetical protein
MALLQTNDFQMFKHKNRRCEEEEEEEEEVLVASL